MLQMMGEKQSRMCGTEMQLKVTFSFNREKGASFYPIPVLGIQGLLVLNAVSLLQINRRGEDVSLKRSLL